MSTITLRATKGSPLTNTEVDTNFSNLNTDKLESTYAGAMNSLTGGSAITTVSSTTGITTGAWKATVIGTAYGGTGVANGSNNTITFTGLSGANIANVVPANSYISYTSTNGTKFTSKVVASTSNTVTMQDSWITQVPNTAVAYANSGSIDSTVINISSTVNSL